VRFFDGTTLLATVSLDGLGRAIFPTKALAIGMHAIRAVYSGDANYDTATRTVVHTVIGPLVGRRWDR
jgi:hypothetical protein